MSYRFTGRAAVLIAGVAARMWVTRNLADRRRNRRHRAAVGHPYWRALAWLSPH